MLDININDLLKLSGSFWSELYDQDIIKTLLIARLELEKQTAINRQELKDCLTLTTTPIYHHEYLLPFKFIKNKTEYNINSNIKQFDKITDKIVSPTIILILNEDYVIENNKLIISLPNNEFDDIFSSDTLDVWLHNVKIDKQWLSNNYGVLIKDQQVSSQKYKDHLINRFKDIVT